MTVIGGYNLRCTAPEDLVAIVKHLEGAGRLQAVADHVADPPQAEAPLHALRFDMPATVAGSTYRALQYLLSRRRQRGRTARCFSNGAQSTVILP